jgi:hypothetical protein
MRDYFYSPEASENLATFETTDDEFTIIDRRVAELAEMPGADFEIPFQDPMLKPSEKLYRCDVGRFKLNYIFNKKDLEVVSVML